MKERFGWMVLICFIGLNALVAQQDLLSFELRESQSLREVLQKIEQEFGLVFAYPERLLNQVQIAPGRWEAMTPEELLADLCRQNNLEYRISGTGDILLRACLQPRIRKSVVPQRLLRGKVIDEFGLPLSNVAVYLDTLNLGSMTDAQGLFQFNIPSAYQERQLVFQLLGYEQQKLAIVALEQIDQISLRTTAVELDPLTVTERLPALRHLQQDGSIRMTPFPGIAPGSILGADIFRTIQLLPGVSAHDDLSAAVKIRGSGGDETLVLLDGIPIYRSTHFFGVFSGINSGWIAQSTLFKNALPAAYGGKTGGMLLMESDAFLYNRVSADIDIDWLTASAILKIPLGKQFALSLGGRTTYQNAANGGLFAAFPEKTALVRQVSRENFTRPDLIQTQPRVNFFDFNAKLLWQSDRYGQLDINYYQSQDNFENDYENTFRVRIGPMRVAENEELFTNREQWSNQGASCNYLYYFADKYKLSSNLYYTNYHTKNIILSSLTGVGSEEDRELWSFANSQSNEVADLGARFRLSSTTSRGGNAEVGLDWVQHRTAFTLQEEERILLGQSNTASELAFFAALPVLKTEKLQLDLGNRLTGFSGTRQWYWSPRLKLRYDWHSKGYFKAAFTHAYQFVRPFVYDNRLGQSIALLALSDGDSFPVASTDNYMIGSNWQLGDWQFDLELYQKDFSGLIEYARLFQGFDPVEIKPAAWREYDLFTGRGLTRGLDFTLSFDQRNYRGWLSYTLSKTSHQFRAIYQGVPFPAEDDRRHQLSWVHDYSWRAFHFTANYVLASGRPFFNLTQLMGPEDLRGLNPSLLFDRLPAYHRIDLGLSYQFAWKWTDMALGVSVFNLTNRDNVKYQQFIYSIPYLTRPEEGERSLNQVIGNTTSMLGRTLNIRLSARF